MSGDAARMRGYSDSIIPQILEIDSPNVHVQSLVISPNLEAMLEHEERQRNTCQNGLPPGLPPPPRSRPGTTESTIARLDTAEPKIVRRGSIRMTEIKNKGTPPMRNPYINPAPFVPPKSPQLSTSPLLCDDSPQLKDSCSSSAISSGPEAQQSESIATPSDKLLWTEPVTWKTLDLQFTDPTHLPRSTETNRNMSDARPESPVRDDGTFRKRTFDPFPVSISGRLSKLLPFSSLPIKGHPFKYEKNTFFRPTRLSTNIEDVEVESSTSQGLARIGLRSKPFPPLLSHAPPGLIHPNTSEPDISTVNRRTSHPPVSHRHSISLPSSPHFVNNSTKITAKPSMQHRTHSPHESFIDLLSPTEPDLAPFSQGVSQRLADPAPYHSNRRPSTADPPITAKKPFHNTTTLSRSLSTPSWSSFGSRGTSAVRPNGKSKLSEHVPPTTNSLTAQERASLVKKTQKLKWMFGQPPGATTIVGTFGDSSLPNLTTTSKSSRSKRHHRGAASVSPSPSEWSRFEGTPEIMGESRRHSVPLSPEDVSFLGKSITEDFRSTVEGTTSNNASTHVDDEVGQDPPISFIDLMDEEEQTDASPVFTPRGDGLNSSSTTSPFEYLSPEEQAAEHRRRKREKLARIHRFLGSGVPINLVVPEPDDSAQRPTSPMPHAVVQADVPLVRRDGEKDTRRVWRSRKGSSSMPGTANTGSGGFDRLKEELNEREKAINVRRAQKMEKVFGVLPPQTLYHTRQIAFPLGTPTAVLAGSSHRRATSSSGRVTNQTNSEPPSPMSGFRNPNRSSYRKKGRPETADSSKMLLFTGSDGEEGAHIPGGRLLSSVYSHYHHSLVSLGDILNRDDKRSLKELHEYLNGDARDTSLQGLSPNGRASISSSVKSDRRRSLPVKTSMASLFSEYSIAAPKPEVTDFEMRRRRAAKLTNFFGVEYRDLIEDILESIEKGVEEERNRGTLGPDEVADLLRRLRSLKTKRKNIR